MGTLSAVAGSSDARTASPHPASTREDRAAAALETVAGRALRHFEQMVAEAVSAMLVWSFFFFKRGVEVVERERERERERG